MAVIIAKIKLYSAAKRDIRPMLKTLRERIRKVQYDLAELANVGLIKTLLAEYEADSDFTTVSYCILFSLLLFPLCAQ
jgi:transcriptional regulator with XRE-family HTH domain